ncbi:type II inositol-1,4,5-trisphosphate 5-phosphatase [Xylariaceae sp. FL1019]|nr:type II inositol-1,4,5-trisphosphate 5-phosphatase [Xylariaceae sp. FL1019]
MPMTNRGSSVASVADASEPAAALDNDDPSTTHFSLSRRVHARRSEFTRKHRIRIKIGSWNVAGCPGTDKDLASWFVDGQGLEPRFDSDLARLNLSENSIETQSDDSPVQLASGPGNPFQDSTVGQNTSSDAHEEPSIRVLGGDKIGLYVLGLQEMVNLNLVHQSFYSDPSAVAKWQDALEAALPKGYTLVASQQMVGLLLLIYASPEVAPTISNESTLSIGTGLLGYMGNKGAVVSRILLGDTTRLVFSNSHLASGHDQGSMDRRCWDFNKIVSQAKFSPITRSGVSEDEGDKIGDEDFSFFFGDLNFRLDGLPGDDIRHILTLHARGEYDVTKQDSSQPLGEEGVIILNNKDDDSSDGMSTPGMISREVSFDKGDNVEDAELPDPDAFIPDPHDDPASLQATIDSLLPHDQLYKVIKGRKAFHEGWREGSISFLPTYKYDVGTVGLFDTSEKKRAPSWCDRILYRTRKNYDDYTKKCQDEIDAQKRDEDMKQRGIDQAADDESVLFDYDPSADSSETVATKDQSYEVDEYDEYEEEDENAEPITTKEGFTDQISLDLYTSHQRVTSSDHKPLVAVFTLDYEAIVPELKAKVHAEVAKELDRVENEGRPGITIVVDGKDSKARGEKGATDGSDGIDFGYIGFFQHETRSLTIANTGGVAAQLSFLERSHSRDDGEKQPKWLEFKFVHTLSGPSEGNDDTLGSTISLEPGETVNAIISIEVRDLSLLRALNEGSKSLEDVLVLSVIDGRDYFLSIRATWQPSCFGRSLEELIRVPRGGVKAFVHQRQLKGAIPYDLEVQNSSPSELFKLTEAIESITERMIADENMIDDIKVPRASPGWPFDHQTSQTDKDDDYAILRGLIIEALENDEPISDALKADVPALKRLEIVSETLLLFLRSMTDGIITDTLWAKIEQALPQISVGNTKSPVEIDDAKAVVLDILSAAPYYNISFVFLTSMLARVANELLPLNKEELETLSTRKPRTLGKRSLSLRRHAGSAVDEGAIQRRLAWERKTAEIFSVAICRASASSNAKEKKTVEDKMSSVLEMFMRREGP